MIENENNENLLFQLSRLQAEGKSVGKLKEKTEVIIWENAKKEIDEQS